MHHVDPEQPVRAPRIVRADTAEVEALYPPRRILGPDALHAEELARHTGVECDERRQEAQAILDRARADARKALSAARRRARATMDKAREEGLRAGAEGFAAALLELQRTAEDLERRALVDARRLAVRFAKALLEVEFSVHPERILDLVEALLRRAGNPSHLEVHLNPLDAALVKPRVEALRERAGLTSAIRVLNDDSLPEHSVRVESRAGVWQGGIDIQLAPLLEHLDSLGSAHAPDHPELVP